MARARLVGRVKVAWLVVQPDAQFFFNPAFSRGDAQALGVAVVAIF